MLWTCLKGRRMLGCKLNDDIYEGLDGVLQAIGREIVARRPLLV